MEYPRVAHTEGHTEIRYSSDGSSVITTGLDGDVRVYNGLDDDNEKSFSVASKSTALAVYKDFLAIGDKFNEVKKFSLPMEDPPSGLTLLRFTGSVNDISVSQNGQLIAAGSSDFTAKITHVNDYYIQKNFTGHVAPVLSVSLDREGQLLASASCDGTLRIWNVNTQECLQIIQTFPKSNDVSNTKSLHRIRWSPVSDELAVARAKKIVVFSPNNWEDIFQAKDEHEEAVSVVCWSPCGSYLASGSINGEIMIWDYEKKVAIKRMKTETTVKICAIDWHPAGKNDVCFVDDQGQFSFCYDVAPIAQRSRKRKHDQATESVDGEMLDSAFDDDLELALTNDEVRLKDEDDEPVSASRKKHKVQNFNNFLDDQADEDSNDSNDPNISLNLLKEGFLPSTQNIEDAEEKPMPEESKLKMSMERPSVSVQKPFQSGSTPIHLMHRFMVWNSVGIVRAHNEDEMASIDIEFHDTKTHHPLHLDNSLNFSMADLSSRAVVFASHAEEEEASKLQCMPLDTWDSNKEWTISLPGKEDIVAVAVNRHFIAVATNHQLIRLFTIAGLQSHIICVPGPVVTVAMHDRQLIIAYHQGSGLPNCQCLGIKTIDIYGNTCKSVDEHQLPLSSKSTLIWFGFSDEGSPVTVDSKGIIRVLQQYQRSNWLPVFDIQAQLKSKSDNYWIIGLSEQLSQIRYVLCKGSQFPATVPRPIATYCEYTFMLCEPTSEKAQLEEEYLRNKSNRSREVYRAAQLRKQGSMHAISTEEVALLMKMFALACKSGREYRALEVCQLMPDPQTVSLAIQYATKVKKMKLAQRLDDLAREKAKEQEEAEEDEVMEEDSDSDLEEILPASNKGRSHPNGIESQVSVSGRFSGSSFSLRTSRRAVEGKRFNTVKEDIDENDSDDQESAEPMQGPEESMNDEAENHDEHVPERENLGSSNSRRNPFKVERRGNVSVSVTSKGTSFFDSLDKEQIQRIKSGKPSVKKKEAPAPQPKKKQKTLLEAQDKANHPSTTKRTENEEDKVIGQRVTGFQLYLKESLNGDQQIADEDEIKKGAEMWRELNKEEKKAWNAKAEKLNKVQLENTSKKTAGDSTDTQRRDSTEDKDTQNAKERKRKRNDNLVPVGQASECKKKTSHENASSSSKSRIASFAFSK